MLAHYIKAFGIIFSCVIFILILQSVTGAQFLNITCLLISLASLAAASAPALLIVIFSFITYISIIVKADLTFTKWF